MNPDSTIRKSAVVLLNVGGGNYLSHVFSKANDNGYRINTKWDFSLAWKSLRTHAYGNAGASVVVTNKVTFVTANFNFGISNYHKRVRFFHQGYVGWIISKEFVTETSHPNFDSYYGLNLKTILLGYDCGIKINKGVGVMFRFNGLLGSFLEYEGLGHFNYTITRYPMLDMYVGVSFYFLIP